MSENITRSILNKIYNNGRGWTFSPKDFTAFGSAEAIHVALHRLENKSTIRRVLRGIYDYPKYSSFLGYEMSPDIDQTAHALARKFAWSIYPSGAAALNLIGISTQVPARYEYLSNGPNREYLVGQTELLFRHAALKESSFKLPESAIIVQALRNLGAEYIDSNVIAQTREWLQPKMRKSVLLDTAKTSEWIYKVIRKICMEV